MANRVKEMKVFVNRKLDSLHNSTLSGINIERGGRMENITYSTVEDLAFVHWQYKANEKAYLAKLITRPVYEFAKNELQKNIERLSEACYNVQ